MTMSSTVTTESVVSLAVGTNNGKSIVAEQAGHWPRVFTKEGVHPFDEIVWVRTDACIKDTQGNIKFEQKDIEVPAWWEKNNVNVVASKYMRHINGIKEFSVKQIFSRVAKTLRNWAEEQDYFNTEMDAEIYEHELIYALLHQYGAFNSPVWFNLGVPNRPQAASACYISEIGDTLESIMDFQKSESTIFSGGSGSGANFSSLRSSYEKLSTGAYVTGPLSWMRGSDQYAQAMKSAGSCLAPYQKVYTESGPVSVKELAESGNEFIVLSYHPPERKYKAKKANAWFAGRKNVVRITTDKGHFDISDDHPIRLSTHNYVEAGKLKSGMSLFSCAINDHNGYLRVNLKDGVSGRDKFHRMIAKDVLGLNIDGMSVHHKDKNPYNNSLGNLELFTDSEHVKLHNNEMVENHIHPFQVNDCSKYGENNPLHKNSEFWKTEAAVNYKESKRKQLVESGLASEMQRLACASKLLDTGFKILNAGGDIENFESYAKSRKKILGKYASKTKLEKSINRAFGGYDNYKKELSLNNHRIVSVKTLGEMDVYDVNVQCPTSDDKSPETGHNFVIWPDDSFIGSGIAVANTRNAAKMVVLDMDHPDILETKDGRPGFIRCKAAEEKRAHALIKAGYSHEYDNPNGAYKNVQYQNANHSVSIPDEFMQAVVDGEDWHTRDRRTNEVISTYKATDLWREISEAAWSCADPGVQFSTTMNDWHTTPTNGRIRASNPCFSAETKVSTEYGLIEISDLYDRVLDGQVNISVHFGDRVETRPAIVFPTGINPLLEVKFRSGRVLNVTPDHNFLLCDGSKKPASELVDGDSVDIQCSEGLFGSFDCGLPDDTKWYEIAGFVVGDGWMTKTTIDSKQHRDRGWKSKFDRYEVGMCFGKDDKDILLKVETFLASKEIPYCLKKQKGSVGESPDYLRIRRKNIFEAMESIACPAGSKSHTKRIQQGVFEASRLNQFAFLSGLFSADGTFRLAKKGNGNNAPNRELRLSSTSLDLLRDTQALLLNLGIKSNIIENRITPENKKTEFKYTAVSGEVRTYRSKNSTHELFVYGHSLRKLRDGMKEIGGMISSRKQFLLDDHLPVGHSKPIHNIWNDEIVSVQDTGRKELTYNMTEFETHTIIAEGIRIPQCSEFLHVDNTACNLCALNLTKFFDDKQFNYERFEQSVRLFVTAQNAIVAKSSYPTEVITKQSHKLRPIGLNYGDLGSLVMGFGYSYDSDEGRAMAARMASLMTGLAYRTSARLSARIGAFSEFDANKSHMMKIMDRHQDSDANILNRWNLESDPIGDDVVSKSAKVWEETIRLGKKYGYTVSQASLQAPLGTISFLMGMNTTGIEPAFSLVSYKTLVGGGSMKLVNNAAREGLKTLGYTHRQVNDICSYIEENDTIEGAPGLKSEHLPVFDCAMSSTPDGRCLPPIAHVTMMAAIQPLITCAISKTVNMAHESTVEDVANIYMDAWKLGIKCIAIYRDGSKGSQPLSASNVENKKAETEVHVPYRDKLPEEVFGSRHRFAIDGYKGYIQMNNYPDNRLGEVFVRLGKPGSTISGLVDSFTKLLSIALQYGVPLEDLIESFADTRFEPAGMTKNPKIRFAKSIYDYIFRHLDHTYFNGRVTGMNGDTTEVELSPNIEISRSASLPKTEKKHFDGPPCNNCGDITVRNGSCYLCQSCGTTTGCS